jgi:exodeoxyribonuclease-3
MRIATFNVNGIRSRLPNLLEWLERETPDVVCLQELKAADDVFPAVATSAAGYGAIWHGQKSWNGVAILARGSNPVETRRGLPDGSDDSHSRYIEATVNGILIDCLYAERRTHAAAARCRCRHLGARPTRRQRPRPNLGPAGDGDESPLS